MIGNKRGITLVEGLVAISITATVLVGVLQMFNLGTSMSQVAENKSRAINLAQGKMEEILENEYDQIRTSEYPQAEAVALGRNQGTLRAEVTQVADGKKVRVVVSWRDNYGDLQEALEALVASPY